MVTWTSGPSKTNCIGSSPSKGELVFEHGMELDRASVRPTKREPLKHISWRSLSWQRTLSKTVTCMFTISSSKGAFSSLQNSSPSQKFATSEFNVKRTNIARLYPYSRKERLHKLKFHTRIIGVLIGCNA